MFLQTSLVGIDQQAHAQRCELVVIGPGALKREGLDGISLIGHSARQGVGGIPQYFELVCAHNPSVRTPGLGPPRFATKNPFFLLQIDMDDMVATVLVPVRTTGAW